MDTGLLETIELAGGRLTLDEVKQTIHLQQDWEYRWMVEDLGASKDSIREVFAEEPAEDFEKPSPWTLAEKRAFHHKCDSLIWQNFSRNVKICATGNSEFALRNKNTVFTMYFDIRWVLANGHWKIQVKKVPTYFESLMAEYVNTSQRTMVLVHNIATLPVLNSPSLDKKARVASVLHEFGHTLINDDEYSYEHGRSRDLPPSPYVKDVYGLMNIGNQLRKRYFDEVIVWMNTMIPDTKFEIDSVL